MTRERVPEERGAIRKDPGGKLRVALVYPNAYRLGMANLGLHAVYRLLNLDPGTACERAFLPEDGSAPRTVESDRPLSTFDVLPSRCRSRTTTPTSWRFSAGPGCRCARRHAMGATRWWWGAAWRCR